MDWIFNVALALIIVDFAYNIFLSFRIAKRLKSVDPASPLRFFNFWILRAFGRRPQLAIRIKPLASLPADAELTRLKKQIIFSEGIGYVIVGLALLIEVFQLVKTSLPNSSPY